MNPYSILELGSQIKRGEMSCETLTAKVIADIRQRDPNLHAMVSVLEERAMAAALTADRELAEGLDRGPLQGIPYVVKDLFDVKGEPNSAGLGCKRRVADKDCALVDRLTASGAILIGQTHTSPLAGTIIGINHHTGTPHNPWKKEHYIPGGSSSGSAVAVSAGLVPFAIGTDTGGSVRVPAALCGIVGFRPVTGTIDLEGCWQLAPSLDAAGCFCHRVEDAATIYSVLAGTPPTPLPPVWGMRVGLVGNIFCDSTRSDIISTLTAASAGLRKHGVDIIPVELPALNKLFALTQETSLIAAEAYALHHEIIDDPEADWVIHWIRKAREYTGDRMTDFWVRLRALSAELATSIEPFQALLLPTVPFPAMTVAECDSPKEHGALSALLSRNTLLGNLAGWSGLALPYSVLSDGLPSSVMFLAAPSKEAQLFALARTAQHASPFYKNKNRPPLK